MKSDGAVDVNSHEQKIPPNGINKAKGTIRLFEKRILGF